ncbi:hypothetical protein ASG59_17500 [Methylobacterium sp. Leaf466]|nr:hypothetical protein ASG59_17500 [Methylobacterium sp. Leaf466]
MRPVSGKLQANFADIRTFIRVAFFGIEPGHGYVAFRAFPNGDNGKPDIRWRKYEAGLASAATAFATEVANWTDDKASVFAPPVCVFGDKKWKGNLRAAEDNVIACLVISLELDERPLEMLSKATGILGEPTLLIRSGGVWIGPNGPEDKLHAYWRLTEAATTPEDLSRLKEVRRGLTRLCGGDGSAPPMSHPMRWPGSWHTKAAPRLCAVIRETPTEISLTDAKAYIEMAADIEGIDLTQMGGERRARGEGFKTPQPLGPASLNALAAAIDNPDGLQWSDWSHRGMAFFDASHGSAEGQEAFDAYSAKNEAKYDPDAVEERWGHWHRSPPDNLSAGTLFRLAQLHSPHIAIPMREPVDVAAVWEAPVDGPGQDAPAEAASAPEGAQRTAANDTDAPDYVQRLNRIHAFVMNKGDAVVLNEDGGGKFSFSARASFESRYANDTVLIGNKEITVGQLWWRSPFRRQFVKGIDFAPEGGLPEGVFNLWPGFQPSGGAAAAGGSCSLILAHIRDILCAGDDQAFRYLVGWLAHMVQRPGDKPGVCVVLKGEKGTGKDTLAYYLDAMMPGLRFGVSQQEQVTGRFTGHLMNVLLLHVEEALWAGSRAGEGALKSLITSPTLAAEFKGVTLFTVRSKLRVLMTSNEHWVVPASADERRFFVCTVSSARRQDIPYFDAIWRERNNGGAAALLAYLQQVDISDFEVRNVPNTEGLRDQKRASLRNFDGWWHDQLEEGAFWDEDGAGREIDRKNFYAAYRNWLSRHRYENEWSEEHIGRRLRELLPDDAKIDVRRRAEGGRYRVYRFPDLETCRRSWCAHYGMPDAFSAVVHG